MKLTPAQLREHAAEIILDHTRDVESLSISEHVEDLDLREPDHDEVCNAIDELIRNADVTVAWPIGTPIGSVIADVITERRAQDTKWGEQNHPDGTGPEVFWAFTGPASVVVDAARHEAQELAQSGHLTWQAVLCEEVAEALAEDDPAKLRAELVQVAAVAAAWAEAIDRRTTTQEAIDADV